MLATDERHRADRFRFDHLRRSFVVSRGALRVLLGRYLRRPPGEIRFRYGLKGKPSLAEPARLQFNVSHSGGLALFAFAHDCELGIDVEQIRPVPELEDIARRFFCVEEAADLLSLPVDQRERAFFLCWTRKEAYIKATGDGLSAPLDDFRVTLRPGEPARLIRLGDDENAAQTWTIHDLDLTSSYASNYAGALAYRDAPRALGMLPAIEPAELLDDSAFRSMCDNLGDGTDGLPRPQSDTRGHAS